MNDGPIVACATPRGEGAISIVRMSGTGVFAIADACFLPADSSRFSSLENRKMIYGTIQTVDRLIDRALAVRFEAPGTFSGEDMVEFHIHGNPLIVQNVVEICVENGCRLAEPGEFSRRAFLNGKMDLSQVEGLAEVIRAESDRALDLAHRQLGGELSSRFNTFRESIVEFLALLELELDFVQEGYELLDYAGLEKTLGDVRGYVDSLLDVYKSGERLRRGPRVVLLGRPNAGKSSLFNAILGHSRAMVSDIPGTTRDYIEEKIVHNGVILHLLDTAGIRVTEDSLEAEGVSRARDLVPLADHVLYLIDSLLDQDEITRELSLLHDFRSEYDAVRFIPVYTKADTATIEKGSDALTCSIYDRGSVSAILDRITDSYNLAVSDRLSLLSERQYYIVKNMKAILSRIPSVTDIPTEFLSADLRELLGPLSELTGQLTNEDILDSVFSGFCIGK